MNVLLFINLLMITMMMTATTVMIMLMDCFGGLNYWEKCVCLFTNWDVAKFYHYSLTPKSVRIWKRS